MMGRNHISARVGANRCAIRWRASTTLISLSSLLRLKALMRDQCQRCNEVYAIPAAIVSSDFLPEENRATLALAAQGQLKILFIAPERLQNADWQAAVPKMRISMVVIDEAHCISVWGHDFRPHYRRIVRLLNALPGTSPCLRLRLLPMSASKQIFCSRLAAMRRSYVVPCSALTSICMLRSLWRPGKAELSGRGVARFARYRHYLHSDKG